MKNKTISRKRLLSQFNIFLTAAACAAGLMLAPQPCCAQEASGTQAAETAETTETTETAEETVNVQTADFFYFQVNQLIRVRSGPGTDYERIVYLKEGAKITAVEIRDNWVRFYDKNETCWVCADYLTQIEAPETQESQEAEKKYYCGEYKINPSKLIMREEADAEAAVKGTFEEGSIVKIDAVQNDIWGHVKSDSLDGWVNMEYLADKTGWIRENDTWEYLDDFGNIIFESDALHNAWEKVENESSKTDFYLAVDCTECQTYIFKGSAGSWKPLEMWECGTGREGHATKKGTFEVADKGYSFGEPEYSCYYYTEFSRKYLFHSIPYEAGTMNPLDERLGQQVSKGCVRLTIEHAKWIYDYIPRYTKVVTY